MYVNQEGVNAAAKLLMHQILARRVRRDPAVLERARARLVSLEGPVPSYVLEWREILALDPAAVARAITERSTRMERLRSASPFDLPELMDPSLRRRIWSKARRRVGVLSGRPWWGQVR